MQRPANHRDLACTLYGTRECVGGGTPTRGVCSRCTSYVASDKAWEAVALTIAATSKAALTKPVPRDKWGEGLNEWIAQRIDSDAGIGSTLARIGTPEAKAILIQLTHGTGCKCRDRTAKADALYPYNQA